MSFSYRLNFPKVMLLSMILFISCNNTPQENNKSTDSGNDNVIILADDNEPGERLVVNVVIKDKETGAPVPDTEVYLYQADTNGEYHPSNPDDESTAKLSGKIISDDKGSLTIKTILPGEYEEPGNRHIHIHYARADGYEQTGGVILFNNNVNDEVRKWANETGFGFIIDVEKVNGTLTGNLDLQLTSINGNKQK